MNRLRRAGILAALLLAAAPAALAQEKFIDVRQAMADDLTEAKAAVAKGDFDAARTSLDLGRQAWARDVKPLIEENAPQNADYKEYFDRIGPVETDLAAAAAALDARDPAGFEKRVNAAIWGISHHPRGFDVPAPRYTAWDWVFALAIGFGFCGFAVWFGLYLRRNYYSRYPRAKFGRKAK
jgi:hypothetical protein